MSPVPSNTVHEPALTAEGARVPAPPPQTQLAGDGNPVGNVQSLPNEALDLAARVSSIRRHSKFFELTWASLLAL
jgi:hypothetical protein